MRYKSRSQGQELPSRRALKPNGTVLVHHPQRAPRKPQIDVKTDVTSASPPNCCRIWLFRSRCNAVAQGTFSSHEFDFHRRHQPLRTNQIAVGRDGFELRACFSQRHRAKRSTAALQAMGDAREPPCIISGGSLPQGDDPEVCIAEEKVEEPGELSDPELPQLVQLTIVDNREVRHGRSTSRLDCCVQRDPAAQYG